MERTRRWHICFTGSDRYRGSRCGARHGGVTGTLLRASDRSSDRRKCSARRRRVTGTLLRASDRSSDRRRYGARRSRVTGTLLRASDRGSDRRRCGARRRRVTGTLLRASDRRRCGAQHSRVTVGTAVRPSGRAAARKTLRRHPNGWVARVVPGGLLVGRFVFLANFHLNQERKEKHKIHVIDFNFKQLVFSLLHQCPCSIVMVTPPLPHDRHDNCCRRVAVSVLQSVGRPGTAWNETRRSLEEFSQGTRQDRVSINVLRTFLVSSIPAASMPFFRG